MPELPEVEYYRHYIETVSLRLVIEDVVVKNEKILSGIKPDELVDHLINSYFEKSTRYGKHLFVFLNNQTCLNIHFGMTGAIHFFHNSNEEPLHSRLLIKFKGKNYLSFDDQRLFGKIGLCCSMESFIKEHHLGIDALKMGKNDFLKIISGRNTPIKTLLMKQELIAGIGNEYSDEILFQAGINPLVKANKLSNKRLSVLFEQIYRVLKIAIDTKINIKELPETFLIVQGRRKRTCPKCTSKLKCMKISGRTSCFCPKCQTTD